MEEENEDEVIGEHEENEELNFRIQTSVFYEFENTFYELRIDNNGNIKDTLNLSQSFNLTLPSHEYDRSLDFESITFSLDRTTEMKPPIFWYKNLNIGNTVRDLLVCPDKSLNSPAAQIIGSNGLSFGVMDFINNAPVLVYNQNEECNELELVSENGAIWFEAYSFGSFLVASEPSTFSKKGVWNLAEQSKLIEFDDSVFTILDGELIRFLNKPNSTDLTYLVYDLQSGELIRFPQQDLGFKPYIFASIPKFKFLGKKAVLDAIYEFANPAAFYGPIIFDFETGSLIAGGNDNFLMIDVGESLISTYPEIDFLIDYEVDIETQNIVVVFPVANNRSIVVFTNFDGDINKIIELDFVPFGLIVSAN